jgi:hypothetical protein
MVVLIGLVVLVYAGVRLAFGARMVFPRRRRRPKPSLKVYAVEAIDSA